jgi:hypothetical protein
MIRERLLAVIQHSPLWCSRRVSRALAADQTETCNGLDQTWYFRAYRRIWPSSLLRPGDAAAHYALNGGRLALSPSLAFDEFWYRHRYPEVDNLVRSGEFASGWEHYLNRGYLERRNPVWWFDEQWYLEKNPDVQQAVKGGHLACGYEHFLLYGIHRDLSPGFYFDVPWYRDQHLSGHPVQTVCPIVDYLLSGNRGGQCPVSFFDPEWYMTTYAIGQEMDSTEPSRCEGPYEHYIFHGRYREWSPSPRFNERAYRDLNPDVSKMIASGRYATGFEHYAREGVIAGFRMANHFSTGGTDYCAPPFMNAYEKSVSLNLKQLHLLRRLSGKPA